jgi:hypothetical protein
LQTPTDELTAGAERVTYAGGKHLADGDGLQRAEQRDGDRGVEQPEQLGELDSRPGEMWDLTGNRLDVPDQLESAGSLLAPAHEVGEQAHYDHGQERRREPAFGARLQPL